MADFMRKALPTTHTASAAAAVVHPFKYDDVVEQESDNPVEVPVAVTPKREGRDDDDDDAETIDLRELAQHPVLGISSTVFGRKARHL
jgi:hypothetical protein